MNFTKTAKTFSEQLTLLKERRLTIENDSLAEFYLNNISYYRLSAYFLSFQKYGDPNHTFMPWATFNRVMHVYLFDRDLRAIVLDTIERIEVAVRCRIVYEYCHTYGPNWYENGSLFNSSHSKFLKVVQKELDGSKEDFILHYFDKYTNPKNPPAWMVLEILSFGTISTMLKNMKNDTAKKNVANYFGISPTILDSWLEHLVYIRNVCAHHSRLWNRTMTVKPTMPKRTSYRWISRSPANPDKIYTTLVICSYLLQRVMKESSFRGKISALLVKYNNIDLKAAGFPEGWERDIFWSKIPITWTYRIRIFYYRVRNRCNGREKYLLK
jgi:abortive infection bacteriophage resistance protein